MSMKITMAVPVQSEEAREDAEALAEERCRELADVEAALEEMEAQEAEALDLLRNDGEVRHVRKDVTRVRSPKHIALGDQWKFWR